jgi:hypothetical protein
MCRVHIWPPAPSLVNYMRLFVPERTLRPARNRHRRVPSSVLRVARHMSKIFQDFRTFFGYFHVLEVLEVLEIANVLFFYFSYFFSSPKMASKPRMDAFSKSFCEVVNRHCERVVFLLFYLSTFLLFYFSTFSTFFLVQKWPLYHERYIPIPEYRYSGLQIPIPAKICRSQIKDMSGLWQIDIGIRADELGIDITVYILLLFWHQISHFFFRVEKPQYRLIPVLTFLKYRYYTGPGIEKSIPNWKH